jgi:serine/threonine protein kinase
MNSNMKVNKIISKSSVHGIIWSGRYLQDGKSKRCVVKMVVLESGETDKKYFQNNNRPPFLHTEFLEKKSISNTKFLYEVDAYIFLAQLGLAPEVYISGIITKFPIHYGYIISERLNCSVKDILLKRELKGREKRKIRHLIEKLHKIGVVHGDMKPSNIGVYLKDGCIKKCYFLDFSKVKYSYNYSEEIFSKYMECDFKNYEKHYIKNRNE